MTMILIHARAERALAPALLAALLAGCAAGPDYVRPPLALPARYTAEPVAGEGSGVPPSADAGGVPVQRLSPTLDIPAQWWAVFHSAPLDDWVRASLAHNSDVAAAQAALRAAQENTAATAAAFWPTLDASYQPSRQKIAGTLASPLASNANLYNLHTAQLTVSYAPDVFGGVRRSVEAARAQEDQQRFQLEASQLALSANVVVAAINEASLRAQREATLSIIESQRQVLRDYRRQLELGQVAPADVDAQEAALAVTEATLPPLDKQLAQQRNQLLVLAGRYPSQDIDAHFDLDALELPAELPLVLPSALVEHRPDVLAAEAQLRAASAGIGVAVAARLPSVLLGVNAYGSSATSLSQLFTSSSMFWTLAAGVTQPLFDGGALQHREAAARAGFEQNAAQYRSTVLGAFQDVANALQAIDADTHALRAVLASERATAKTLERTRAQLRLGDASAMAVLLAQQSWQQAVLNLVKAKAARLTDTAALFQALGGGWWNRADSTVAAQGEAAGAQRLR